MIKRALMGLIIAIFSFLWLKEMFFGKLILALGIAWGGLLATLAALLTPLGFPINVPINLLIFKIPLLYLWLGLDLLELIFKLPVIGFILSIVTFGLGFLIRKIPFLIKLITIFWLFML